MAVDNLGLLMPWEVANAFPEDLTEVAMQWDWVNRNPFFTRLGAVPLGQVEFHMSGTNIRPQTVALTAAAAVGDTTLTLADVSYLQNGDTLELLFANGATEQIQLIAEPNGTNSTIAVIRGDAYTIPGAAPAGTVMNLVANARTGAETDQHGYSPVPWKRINWAQSLQNPVEISGLLQDSTDLRTMSFAPGALTPLDAYRMNSLGNLIDDIERMIVYQRGIGPTASSINRAKTKGIRQQLSDAGTLLWQPANYAAYGPSDFVRDVIETPAGVGGAPNLYFVSNDFIGGLARWKMDMVRIDMGTTDFDIRIDAFRSTVSPNGIFIYAPRLRRGTIIALNSKNTYLRYMRMPTWFPRGRRGDTYEGDIIARLGVNVDHPEQQIMVEGIAGFAAA
jgi:hypothetical protein